MGRATMQEHAVQKLPAHQVYKVLFCEDHLTDPDTVQVFDNYFGVFEDGTRLAMSKTEPRAGLIVIEAWFRGY